MYVHSSLICKVFPIYVVKDGKGKYWRCTEDSPGAIVFSYDLVDSNGNRYSCGNDEELQRLGVVQDKPTTKVGFIGQDGGENLAVDTADKA
jgi:hypothetical protein